jgi:hypothetical protein
MVHVVLLKVLNQLQMALSGSALQELATMRSLKQAVKQMAKIFGPLLTQ